MKKSIFIQRLFDAAIGNRKLPIPKSGAIASKLFFRIKDRIKNHIIDYPIGENKLSLPVYHGLPWYFKASPLYSKNLPRIAGYLENKYTDFTVIDIGANIGDSAYLLRERLANTDILCVEGNPEYLPLLEINVGKIKRATIAKKFVGKENTVVKGILVSDGGGTTFTKETGEGDTLAFDSLNNIVNESGINRNIRMVKIDTDGYDCEIIKDNLAFLNSCKPVLFFEYAPAWFPKGTEQHADFFETLSANRYNHFIFYDGNGNYLSCCDRTDLDYASKQVHFYLTYKGFGDIAAWHDDDVDLYNYSLDMEKKFYLKK
ncbi:MAG TPA: FkbM family methyltransferase, partial [Chitinophagaceae bacterium]